MKSPETIVGIDLGTTNSELAAWTQGKVEVIGPENQKMLPSCVGLSASGELLVGAAARHQQLLYPERTVRSIKRKMGSDEKVTLGNKTFTPQELSALILRELAEWGRRRLGHPVRKAIITVPAFFSDAQRNATREAGALAGLDVLRILNEPTAAALAYGDERRTQRTLLVYDLGGGTFDVSLVTLQDEVTEVLASHGNNHLGGDDFNQLILDRLLEVFADRHHLDLREGHPAACSRLWWAAEEAKKTLSFEPYVTIREENLAEIDGKPLHLEYELSREEYEEKIRSLVETTLDSVSRALKDAGKKPDDLEAILLVGGATRTPMVSRILREHTGLVPRQEIHPDLCVALGAGVLASRLAGRDIERVLVDVSPYSFGPSYVGFKDGEPYRFCYHPVIPRNTPLPITRTDRYYTMYPEQTRVELKIFQGENPDALKNTLVGQFAVEGLTPGKEEGEVLCRMCLDLDGILRVTAVEKRTGLSKTVKLTNALGRLGKKELAAGEERVRDLYARRGADLDGLLPEQGVPERVEEAEETAPGEESARPDPAWRQALEEAATLLERAGKAREYMHPEDREETERWEKKIRAAIETREREELSQAMAQLGELLFFVEGKV